MKKLLLFAAFCLLSFMASAQYAVTSIEPDNGDLTAKNNPKQDRNGQYCSLLKITTVGINDAMRQKFVFSGDMGTQIVDVSFPSGAIMVYLSPGQPTLMIKHPDFGNVTYDFPIQLEPKHTYKMTIEMEMATLTIKTFPSDAEIFINGEKLGKGYVTKNVAIGVENRYKVIAGGFYYPKEDVIVFKKKENKEMMVELEPNFGYLTVTSEPNGADVYIDKDKVGVTPYSMKKVKTGQHNIRIEKDAYQPYTSVVDIQQGDMKTIEATLISDAALLTVTTADNAEIWINGEKKGIGSWSGSVSANKYTIEAHKPGCRKQIQAVDVKARENKTVSFNPLAPSSGDLEIITYPKNVNIKINGESKGSTPKVLNNMPLGTYKIEFSKMNYHKTSRDVTIVDGEKTRVEVELTPNKSMREKGFVLRPELGISLANMKMYEYQITSEKHILFDIAANMGYQFGNFYLGLGAGLLSYASATTVPMYINPRFYFSDKPNALYFDLKVGWSYGIKTVERSIYYGMDPHTYETLNTTQELKLGGLTYAIEFGIDFKHSNIGLVLNMQNIIFNNTYPYQEYNINTNTYEPATSSINDHFFSLMLKYSYNIIFSNRD